MFQAAAQKILVACAKLLEPKLNDRYAVLRYVAEHEDRGEVVGTLLAMMYDLVPCPNCNKEVCQDGETVKNEEFRVGLPELLILYIYSLFSQETYNSQKTTGYPLEILVRPLNPFFVILIIVH